LAANLVDEGSFDEACQGCEYVIHCASPYSLNVADPQKELVVRFYSSLEFHSFKRRRKKIQHLY